VVHELSRADDADADQLVELFDVAARQGDPQGSGAVGDVGVGDTDTEEAAVELALADASDDGRGVGDRDDVEVLVRVEAVLLHQVAQGEVAGGPWWAGGDRQAAQGLDPLLYRVVGGDVESFGDVGVEDDVVDESAGSGDDDQFGAFGDGVRGGGGAHSGEVVFPGAQGRDLVGASCAASRGLHVKAVVGVDVLVDHEVDEGGVERGLGQAHPHRGESVLVLCGAV